MAKPQSAQGPRKAVSNTKTRIEQAAADQFARRGADGVTTRAIAAASNISEGALYRHFESKAALARAVTEKVQSRLLNAMETIKGASTSPAQQIDRIADLICEFFEDTPAPLIFYLNTLQMTPPPHSSKEFAREFECELEKIIAKNGDSAPTARLKGAMMLGAISQILRQEFHGRAGMRLNANKPVIAAALRAIMRS